jgi:ABC-2 type transport system permease protein
MHKLCWKDFYIIRLFLIPAPFFFVILLSTFVFSGFLFLSAAVILTFFMVISIPIIEDKYRTEQIISSLPVKKQSIVLSRYISSFFITGIGLFLYFVSGFLYKSIFKDNIAGLKSVVSLEGGVVFFFLSLLLVSLFLPFYFKLGISRALLVFPAVVAVLSAVIWLGIESVSLNLQESLNTPLSLYILFILLSGIMGTSILISIKAYKLKEL